MLHLGRSAAQAPPAVPPAEDALLRRVEPDADLVRVFVERARELSVPYLAEIRDTIGIRTLG